MPAASVSSFEEVLKSVGALVDSLDDDEWRAPTPCTGWNVRHLVAHLISGQHDYRAALEGSGQNLAERSRMETPTDEQVAAASAGAFRTGAETLIQAFSRDGALDVIIQSPIGSVPGAAVLELLSVEYLTHGWDLSRSVDRAPSFGAATVEHAIQFVTGILESLPPDAQIPFEPSCPAPPDAAPLDRLAALLGRRPAG